jgi:signal transduction histidine kinase
MQTDTSIQTSLKDAAQLSSASWVVLAERIGGAWLLHTVYHLNKSGQNELVSLMSRPSIDAWLCGALSGGYSRSGSIPEGSNFEVGRLFVFPISGSAQAIIVGADDQSSDAQRIWKLTASLLAGRSASPNPPPFLPDLQSGLVSDLPLAIGKTLSVFVQASACQGAWLAIRRGDSLDIQAEWNDPKATGVSMLIDENPILRRVNRSLYDVVITRDQPNWDNLPYGSLKSGIKSWVCLPLVIGQRLIGVVALWRQKEFSRAELGQLRELVSQVSPSVEVLVTFSEMAAHLRRLGLLNDFVLTVSSAQNLDQIARRVFGLLSRAFNTELIALFLRSSDGRVLRDYRTLEGKMSVVNVSLAGHSIQPMLKEGRARRIQDTVREGFIPLNKGARSMLIVPLKYRGQAIGVLIIENLRAEAFNQYDEHLMVVIASHLAGLIEYTRLREEAEGRARSLGLIHEVVQQVIGLHDKSEVAFISADLVAQYFKYELAVVLLTDDEGKFSVQGIGGTQSEAVKRALVGHEFLDINGVTGRVSQTGESMLVNDTRQEKLYAPLKGWEARSEICVALKDGGNILGIVDVESRSENAFAHNDLIAIEALAGILTSVITSANQYQRLQETIRQLRATEIELNARMEAQRSAENRLVQAAKLAAVGEMAAGIAHELNNPLTTVTGFSELVLEDLPQDFSYRQELEMVSREAHRASDVVRRLLDFSRQGERTRARADLNEIVHDVIALTRHLIQTNKVNLTLKLDENLPWVSIDRNQMKQVLLNLIHNALQAMPKGGELLVETHPEQRDDRNWVIMSVRDSGIGITPADQNRVFEPFFTTKGDRGGTGLGLSVTYGIVTDHGGTIEIASEPKKGATFTVWLPL